MINIHESCLNPDAFCDLLMLPEDINTIDTEEIPEVDTTTNQPEINKKHAGGRPSKHKQFPAIVTETISFLRLYGFAANSRQRNLTANSCGVTLEDLRQHLFDNIPALKEHGISRKTAHHLMMPPRAGTHAAKNYKHLIQARIPKKSNNQTASEHKDLHFCRSQAAMFIEAGEYFHDEVIRISADDKNKVNVGTLAVSRYHQISCFFVTNDNPEYLDHDFPIPGYKITPYGYLVLRSRSRSRKSRSHVRSKDTHFNRPREHSPCSRRSCSALPQHHSKQEDPVVNDGVIQTGPLAYKVQYNWTAVCVQ